MAETEDYDSSIITIGFASGYHGDGSSFDGPGGTLAHAFAPTDGRLHCDADESWAIEAVPNYINLWGPRANVVAHVALQALDLLSGVAVQIGAHVFTFDYVYGSSGQHSSQIYEECVAPLVDALCQGYNGTVLAYGQAAKFEAETSSVQDGEYHFSKHEYVIGRGKYCGICGATSKNEILTLEVNNNIEDK
ncbi:hypothetical protein AgCh_008054 [Apium graveolens]